MSINDPMMESKHHLPECPVTTQRTEWGGRFPCFCVELRAAEQRGYETGCIHSAAKYPYIYSDGVKAARDAVEHFHRGSCRWYYTERRCTCGLHDAIDALEKP